MSAELLGVAESLRYLFFLPAAGVYTMIFFWQRARKRAGKGAPRMKLNLSQG